MFLIMLVSWYANSLQWLFFYQKLSDLTTSYRKEILWLLWNWLFRYLLEIGKQLKGCLRTSKLLFTMLPILCIFTRSVQMDLKIYKFHVILKNKNIVKSLSVFTCLSRCYWKNLACFFITYSGLCRRVIITRWLSFRAFFCSFPEYNKLTDVCWDNYSD